MSGNFYKFESADKYSPQVISAIWPKYMDVCICCFKKNFKRKEKKKISHSENTTSSESL